MAPDIHLNRLLLFAVLILLPILAGVAGLVVFLVSRSRRGPVQPVPPVLPPKAVSRSCPQCGAPLKPDAPEGLCPTCLLKQGIASESGAPPGQAPFIPPSIPELAKLFPQLEILEPIGKGGMGAVYKARQPALDRVVALKILAPPPGNDLDFASRFSREARALARLNHPNIVAVFDFGQVNGLSYFIMEYVDGPNLRQVEQSAKLSPREALQIIPQICVALQFAHDEGIVHRDIKPENVLLDKKGRVKIADFGLAKILGQEPKDLRLTGAKDVMGTPHYMAPEQVEKPQEVDHRADIYSLGVVFYELLTGELPLGKFQPPSQKVSVDVRLDEIVLRALAKEPERRYQQASDLKTEVDTVVATPGAAVAAPPRLASPRAVPSSAPHFSRTAIIGACWALLFPVIGILWALPSRNLRPGSMGAPSWLIVLLISPFIAVAFSAPFGTTILGWISVSQIRRSAGKLYGLALAVFDGLLFPLIALDIGIGLACLFPAEIFSREVLNFRNSRSLDFATWLFFAGSTMALVDFLVVRWTWRAVTRSLNGERPSARNFVALWKFAVVVLAGMLLVVGIATLMDRQRKERSRRQIEAAFQTQLVDRVDRYLSEQQIAYETISIGINEGSPEARIMLTGLRDASAPAGHQRSLEGDLILRMETPDEWQMTGTGDLSHIRCAFSVPSFGRGWWPETSEAPVAQKLVFGSVIERVIQARETETNLFLDLDKGCLLTPSRDVLDALRSRDGRRIDDRMWQGLDLRWNTRPFRYVGWLRDSGADLAINNQGGTVAFDGIFAILHADNQANWDDWDAVAPDHVRTTLGYLRWRPAMGAVVEDGQLPGPPPGIQYSFATRLSSSEPGGPVVSLLTRDQSTTWYFQTREGSEGVLQIENLTGNSPGVKIRLRRIEFGPLDDVSNPEFRRYTVDRTWSDLGESFDLSTPENALPSTMLRIIDGTDDASVFNQAILGFPRYPPGDFNIKVSPADAAETRAQRVVDVVLFREDLAGVVTRQQTNGMVRYLTATLGHRGGDWKILLREDLDPALSRNAAVDQFKSNADRLWRSFQNMAELPDGLVPDSADLPVDRTAELMRLLVDSAGTLQQNVITQMLASLTPALTNTQKLLEDLERGLAPATAGSVESRDLEFRWVAADNDTHSPADVLSDPSDPTGKGRLRVLKEVVLDGSAIASAAVTVHRPFSTTTTNLFNTGENDQREINLTLTDEARIRFAAWTAAHVGQRLAIVWHGRLLSAPIVRDAIVNGKVKITGRFSEAECQQLLRAFSPLPTSANADLFKAQTDKLKQLEAEMSELQKRMTLEDPRVRELQRQITALKRQIQNDRIASGPDALAARIQRLIRNTPARTGYDFEIWESDMTSPSSYRIRSDVVQRPIRSGTTTLESPNGMAYYLPSKHRFYIQWDSMGASTLHYYGPFDGDPVEVLGLK